MISIHAPREGSDAGHQGVCVLCFISIHAPREGSDERYAEVLDAMRKFQSTLPARGATAKMHKNSKSFL